MLTQFNTQNIDKSWLPLLNIASQQLPPEYLQSLQNDPDWLPGPDKIFNAFAQPIHKTHYILFGESPYPRSQSANGFAFWDANCHQLWSETGLASTVNRATSLRNMIKMLLVAEGSLSVDATSQTAIQRLDKSDYIDTVDQLFNNMINKGFLLLNASLVLRSTTNVQVDGKMWLPFMESLLEQLQGQKITLILFGKIAEKINRLPAAATFPQLVSEHPYNLSFISNPDVLSFFQPFHLLKK